MFVQALVKQHPLLFRGIVPGACLPTYVVARLTYP